MSAFRELPVGARQYPVHAYITFELHTESLVGCAGFARYRVNEC